jgi:D-proline reductase (dithiol) PrdB
MSPVAYIPRTRELYSNYPPYRWVINDDCPWTPLSKPLSECRVALLTSGGVHHVDQAPFHFKEDTSFREIPTDTAMEDLRVSHYGYRTEDASTDSNCVFPLERMRELESAGLFGELVDPAFAMMGGIYSARKVQKELVPALMERFDQLRVDVLYLVPA